MKGPLISPTMQVDSLLFCCCLVLLVPFFESVRGAQLCVYVLFFVTFPLLFIYFIKQTIQLIY